MVVMGKDYRVFTVGRNFIFTNDASDKVRLQCIEGPKKGKGVWFLKSVKLVK